jgi:hypothetical protein
MLSQNSAGRSMFELSISGFAGRCGSSSESLPAILPPLLVVGSGRRQ